MMPFLLLAESSPPLVGLRIVHTQGQAFDVAGWAIDFDGVQLGATIPNLEADASPCQFNPGSGAG